ncbi:hypothetical protein LG329_07235 [Virgibacillus necropolis]|uniref:hypothetical protein n=1 Tax=Virgibacillus necropolis TaxID=163877 RepID=UPI00384E8F5F
MKKTYYILLGIWGTILAYAIYKYSQGMGYWGNPLMLSVVFYVLAIIVNKRFNVLLIFIAVSYFLMAIYIVYDMFIIQFPSSPSNNCNNKPCA